MRSGLACLLAVILWAAPVCAPVFADENQRLDRLYAQLKASETQEEADAVVNRIWVEWLKSGNPAIDDMMRESLAEIANGRLKRALAVLNTVVQEAPDYAEGWNSRATVLYLLGAYDRSVADIGRTLALEPRHFGAMAGLAKILVHQGRFAEALAIYRKALKVNPYMIERKRVIPMLEEKIKGEEI